MEEKTLSEKESLELITRMIHTAKNSFVDTGIGPILWGAVISVCSLVQAAQIHFNFELPFDIWFLALIAVIPQIWISIQESKDRKVRSWTDQIISYVWMTFGVGVFILNFINNYYAVQVNPVLEEYTRITGKPTDLFFWNYATSYLLFLYGIPTIITAAAHRFKLMLAGGILCWILCITALFTSTKIDFLLIALAAVMAWLVPGIVIRCNYLSQRKQKDV